MTTTLTNKQLLNVVAGMEAKVATAVLRGIRDGARAGVGLLVQKTPKDTGLLKASWKVSRVGSKLESGSLAEIVNTAPHAGIVEAGARPHPVSEEGQEAIYRWVLRHFRMTGRGSDRKVQSIRDTKGKGSRLKEAGRFRNAEAVKIMQGICRKLALKGQAPTYFVKQTIPEINKATVDMVVRELEALARKHR